MTFIITSITGSAFLSLFLIIAGRRTGWLNRRNDLRAVQASHTRQVSRLGGLGIVLGAALSLPMLPSEAREPAILLFLSVLPVFCAGLVEDLGYGVSPKGRLLAAALSSVLAIGLTGTWIRSAGIPGIDAALALAPVGIALTLLWASGLCHATNLIDGMNGLAGSFAGLAGLGLAGLAWSAGDTAMVSVALLVVAATVGFLLFNWPRGLIFLGDAGAYSLGHLMAWIGIMIAARNPQVAGMAVALVFFWPIADTLFAIYRRRRLGKPFDQPDRMHVHQIVMRWLEIAGLGRSRRYISNPLTTLVLMPFMALPIGLALWLPSHGTMALGAFLFCAAGFVTVYGFGTQWARARRNPIDVVRLTPTVPVTEDALPLAAVCHAGQLVLEPSPDVRLLRRSNAAHWNAFVRDRSGTWRRLDRSFPSSARAYRAAMRIRFRTQVTRRSRRLPAEAITS